MNVLLLLDDEWDVARVAKALFLDIRTGEEYRRLYKASGASGDGTLGYNGHPFSQMMAAELFALKAHMAIEIRAIACGASFNHGPDVQAFLAENPRLILIKLPAYSPDLNLIECLWLLFKKNLVYNSFHRTFADFKTAIDAFFEALSGIRDVLASLLTPKFHLFQTTPAA
jgi:hypothetical protein